ncbi:MarR family winged helix-turn-helix transcriptional regulator [Mesorhizobium sp. ESP7-2]|uniref:MarR family winged helix-turn-helix transcriptional regulator n=1 Tax=Mesorhizobium sp. ESP7-2 TaxID=2876622 RepID=UPI001CCDA597|nr:MarR family winged helix-turn-helix transcriptional regulator [Mesorhizobium sp. ESP7-2]MBZ9708616.1 MarR family winged helix-turn-helix transcriptional regulator [Mesorhizobium sp. ESP7-2]
MRSEREPTERKKPSSHLRWADLADLILIIAREIQFRGYQDENALSLSQSEGVVMRHLVAQASATPSQIAAATGLQRTNVSTVLRDLEAKGLIERHVDPQDRRGVSVHRTRRGAENYALVRKEWGDAVSAAAGGDTSKLDDTLGLLRAIEIGLSSTRPKTGDGR